MGFIYRGVVLVVYGIVIIFLFIVLFLNVFSCIGGIFFLLVLLLVMEIFIEGLNIWGENWILLFNFLKFIGNSDYR